MLKVGAQPPFFVCNRRFFCLQTSIKKGAAHRCPLGHPLPSGWIRVSEKDLDPNRELRYHGLGTDSVAVLAGTFSCVMAVVLLKIAAGVVPQPLWLS